MIVRYVSTGDNNSRVIIGAWCIGRVRVTNGKVDFYGTDELGTQTVQTYENLAQFEASLEPQPVMPQGYYGVVEMRGSKAVCIRPDGSVAGAALGTVLDFQSAFGGLRRYDCGKRIFRRDGVFQMENDDQKNKRLEREARAVLNSIPQG